MSAGLSLYWTTPYVWVLSSASTFGKLSGEVSVFKGKSGVHFRKSWVIDYPRLNFNLCIVENDFSLTALVASTVKITLTSLKVVSATVLLVCFLSLNKSTCQTRKNVFYFTSKALSVL